MRFKRVLAMLLAASLTLGCFAGCGKKDDSTKSTSTSGTTETSNTNGEDTQESEEPTYPFEIVDLDGYVFTVSDNNVNRWFPEEGSSEIANAILNRVNMVQDLFNCTIEVVPYDETEFANAVLVGEKYADIIVCETWSIARHILAGRVRELQDISQLHMDNDYWYKNNTHNLLSYQGMIHGASAPFAAQTDEIFMMFFNKRIIEELNLESPYDLYDRNEWTMSKFLEYCIAAKRDLNGDGVFDDNDRYGLTCGHNWDTPVVLYLGTGMKFYSENPDGTIEFQLNTPAAFKAVNQIKQITNPGETFWPKPESDEMSSYAVAFAEGKSLFYTYTRGRDVAKVVFDMEDDFGIVPIPRGDNAETYNCWVSHDAPSIAIPVTNKDYEKTALIVEALAYFAQEENELELDEFCSTRLRDDKSEEILRKLPEYACTDLAVIGQQLEGSFFAALNSVVDVCFAAREKEIASTVAGIEISVETGIETFYEVMLGTAAEE